VGPFVSHLLLSSISSSSSPAPVSLTVSSRTPAVPATRRAGLCIDKLPVRSLPLSPAASELAATLRRVARSGATACVAVTGPARAVAGRVGLADVLCFFCTEPKALSRLVAALTKPGSALLPKDGTGGVHRAVETVSGAGVKLVGSFPATGARAARLPTPAMACGTPTATASNYVAQHCSFCPSYSFLVSPSKIAQTFKTNFVLSFNQSCRETTGIQTIDLKFLHLSNTIQRFGA
jgi:hypothetical protein